MSEESLTRAEVQHVVGNSLFAIETNLSSLRRRCKDVPDAPDLMDSIQRSIEKIKKFIATQDEGAS